MMYIEKHWETVDSLRDISRIIREYYNYELADEMDKLIEIQEDRIDELENNDELDKLYETIYQIRELVVLNEYEYDCSQQK